MVPAVDLQGVSPYIRLTAKFFHGITLIEVIMNQPLIQLLVLAGIAVFLILRLIMLCALCALCERMR